MLKLPHNCFHLFISHASKVMLKILQARLQQYMNCELPDVQTGFRKGRGTRDQIANIWWIIEKAREFQKKHLLLLYWLHQNLWLCGSQLWNFLKRWEDQTTSPASWEICMQVEKQQLEPDMEHRLVPNWEKSMSKLYCHPAYLTSMPSTSCKMLGWMKHKLESRLLGQISITSDMQMTPPLWQKAKRNWGVSWWKWKRRVKKLA